MIIYSKTFIKLKNIIIIVIIKKIQDRNIKQLVFQRSDQKWINGLYDTEGRLFWTLVKDEIITSSFWAEKENRPKKVENRQDD